MQSNWIKQPAILTGEKVQLVPLERKHVDELLPLTKDKSLWQFFPKDYSVEKIFFDSIDEMITGRENGTHYPFITIYKPSQKIIGSTMLFDLNQFDKRLEIGRTWLIKDFRGGGINTECKKLLLKFCFEELRCVRVQFKATETNLRSRKAIEKIGGKLEGVIRKERLMENGTWRNAAIYSILDD